MIRIGVDVGGTGVKAGIVNLSEGVLVGDDQVSRTPKPASPEAVARTVAGLVERFDHPGPVGIGFPAVIEGGVVKTANNIDPSWIGVDAVSLFGAALGREAGIVNDADAAALAEARYGVARGIGGTVLVITFGTGIGCGLLHDGRLVPNVQIGDIELDGHRPAEIHFAAKARGREDLGWEEWAARANRFLTHVSVVLRPRLIVVGGGVAEAWGEWGGMLDPDLQVVPASMGNQAGIIGAATLVG
jgi:polyphosphate glucokinase